MSTSDATLPARADAPLVDARFAKTLVIACALVPALLLAYDAVQSRLGVNAVNFAIRSTGLLGLVFLSLSLVVTPLRRLTGWSALIAVRRNLGVYGFLYIAAHFLIFFGWDRAASISSTLTEIVERVYLWFGTGALVLMIPLAITSTDGMVTRLGPVWWKRLHRLAYVVVLLGLAHYYLLVKADTTKPFAFAVVFGALMLYRIVMHYVDLRREVAAGKAKLVEARAGAKAKAKKKFWQGELRIARIFDETHDVKTFRLVPPDGGALPFEHVAGQYLNLALTIDGKRVNRSYTIASAPTRSAYVEISVKRAPDGHGSKHLHATWKEGDLVKVSAPAGKFYFAGTESDRVVLLAGGVGITPAMSVIRALTDRGWRGQIYLAYAVRTGADVIFREELAYLERRYPNLHVTITLSQADPVADAAWTGARGHLTRALLDALVPGGLTRGPVMMCGPGPMMLAMRRLLVDEMKLPDGDVHEEAFVSPPASADAGAAAPAPAAAVDPDAPADVHFRRADKRTEIAGLTVLEAAEECGVAIAYECRSGICGQCKTKLVSGRVAMDVQDALTAADRAKGLVLACQARAIGDVVVDA